jgi:hypothetical protein
MCFQDWLATLRSFGALLCRIAWKKEKKGNLNGPSVVSIVNIQPQLNSTAYQGGGNENGLFIPPAHLNRKYSVFQADIS